MTLLEPDHLDTKAPPGTRAAHALVRIATAGSVDDGKSTLIARLLLDTNSVPNDHVAAMHRASTARGHAQTNLALLTDGLRAEREEGITIDVAHRFFSTVHRSFVLSDTPGHEQYTRNMVTGTSEADVVIVLVDARNGVVSQTRRHAYIASLLGIPKVVLAVNKMDFVEWSQSTWEQITDAFQGYLQSIGSAAQLTSIPVSALHGDNVATLSPQSPWFNGPSLLDYLNTTEITHDTRQVGARLAVQWVSRPMDTHLHDYRGYSGRLWGGSLSVNDAVTVLPSGRESVVSAIDAAGSPITNAVPGQAITVQLVNHIDVGRGDLLAATASTPLVTTSIDADLCWMDDVDLVMGKPVLLKHTTRTVQAIVERLEYLHDIESGDKHEAVPSSTLRLNDIGRVHIRTSEPLVIDDYQASRETGSFILIDRLTNNTIAAGLVRQ